MEDLKKKTLSGLAYKFGEQAGTQGVNFLVSVVLARLLLPEQFGAISLCMVFIAILDVFVTYGFGNSLVVNRKSDDLDFSTCFYFGLLLSFVVYICVFVLAKPVAIFFKEETLVPVLQIMSLRIPIAAINTCQHAYVSKHMIFRKLFISASFGISISGIISIAMAYMGFGIWALVAQYLGTVTIDTVCLFILLPWRPKLMFSFNRLRKIYDYGWKILAVGLVDTGYNQLRNLIIAKKYTTSDLAFYGRGMQFPSLGMNMIEPTINGVIFPSLSNCNDDPVQMKSTTRRVIQVSSYIIFPIMIGLIAVSKPLVICLLTEKWLDCVIYLQIGCLAFLFRPIQVINCCVISASGRSGLLLKLDIVKKTVGVFLLLLSIPYGVVAIAISLMVTNLISTAINIYPNTKILNYGIGEQFTDIWDSLFLSLIMGGVMYLVSWINWPYIMVLIIQIILGLLTYLLLSIISKNNSYQYLYELTISIIKKNKQ